MTREELEKIGCKMILWNRCIPEYYLPVRGDGLDIRDQRLSVIFDDHPDHPVMAWFIIQGAKIALPHVTNIEHFATMYFLLTGKHLDVTL